MRGEKRASAHDIVFQARAGSPELNCCSVNGPKGLALLSEWAALTGNDGIYLNYYGDCELMAATPNGGQMQITQITQYPLSGDITIKMSGDCCPVFIRIPAWSKKTRIISNGETIYPAAGNYFKIEAKTSDVELFLDMSLHYWVGDENEAGNISIYHGPLLLAYDQRFNEEDIHHIPKLTDANLEFIQSNDNALYPRPLLLLTAKTAVGDITLCDFMTAGFGGTEYTTWLPLDFELSQSNQTISAYVHKN
jgi:DUF1680 family protein